MAVEQAQHPHTVAPQQIQAKHHSADPQHEPVQLLTQRRTFLRPLRREVTKSMYYKNNDIGEVTIPQFESVLLKFLSNKHYKNHSRLNGIPPLQPGILLRAEA